MISRQMSACSDEGVPVVIPRAKTTPVLVEKEKEREVKEVVRPTHWWEKALPQGITEELVHMAFTVS